MQPTIGRIVHFVTRDGKIRPMIIVQVWSPETVNGVVFYDGTNDGYNPAPQWETSVPYSENETAFSWHWPPKV